ncbi:hypothetical protein [Sphaerisporangium fuscum]|uniref:hypothetical protein n=1 Tax=Sphaerisporangium fuscum TaxID=2835868 RepID=UPI001BDD68E4|nr:hypothetical protein [Sphaerisporangium fuscum]
MRLIRTALAAAALGVAVLTTAGGPAMADAKPSPSAKPAEAKPSSSAKPAAPSPVPSDAGDGESAAPKEAATPRPAVPRGAPETGGGPAGSVLVPAGGALLAAGAGMGVLALRRRARTEA